MIAAIERGQGGVKASSFKTTEFNKAYDPPEKTGGSKPCPLINTKLKNRQGITI